MESFVVLAVLFLLLLPPLIIFLGVLLGYAAAKKQLGRRLDQVSETLRRQTEATLAAQGLSSQEIEAEMTRIFSSVGNRILTLAEENGTDLATAKQEFFVKTDNMAVWLDSKFFLPGGFRFGVDPFIGLIPVVGDFATTTASTIVLVNSMQYGLPRPLVAKMATNVGVDYVFGLVPFAGDVFDLFFKANKKNMVLLQEHIDATKIPTRFKSAGTSGLSSQRSSLP